MKASSVCASVFADLPSNLTDEFVETLIQSSSIRVERIVSHGHASPEGFWYDQPQHEWVVVLKGEARIRFDDRTVEMKPGNWIKIPAHQKHRIDWTTKGETTVWLAIHYS